ncbi:helix-turn-helix domain-containing protein [Streptomyces sp. NBC_00536]|uniref:helix-turn-helix domain-containing protein n=1 Tax=Streptomyces sp. NBC_00536 TaxID=2975769 RepID=UPI002E8160BC|nr:helix-turn-helix transcriptional regulator [Streptomyces sp. NBC_00536]WUC80627.1 helix-turn-helix domain-containing protein [Streptomyces sp. NBC_00536]
MSTTDPGAAAMAERRAAVADFATALRQLRVEAGKPSFRAMAGATGVISHTTLHEAASGSRLPSWPTTRIYVQACGGCETEWHQRWVAAAKAASVPEPAGVRAGVDQRPTGLPAVPPDAAGTSPEPGQDQPAVSGHTARRGRLWRRPPTRAVGALIGAGSPRRFRVLTYVVVLMVGAAIGAGTVLATHKGTVTVTGPAKGTGTVTAPAPGAPGYVARIASATGTTYATSTRLPVTHAVAAGDTLVVAMMLTNTHTGTVSATDSQGNTYTPAADQADDGAGDRTLVLTAIAVKALSTSDTIALGYPSTGEQHLAVDELTNVKAVDRHAAATGAAGTDFTSGPTPTTTAGSELVFGVAGVQGGAAATWASGFTALPTLSVSHDQLATGYKTVAATGAYAAAGTCDHQWMAAAVAFAPSGPSAPPV